MTDQNYKQWQKFLVHCWKIFELNLHEALPTLVMPLYSIFWKAKPSFHGGLDCTLFLQKSTSNCFPINHKQVISSNQLMHKDVLSVNLTCGIVCNTRPSISLSVRKPTVTSCECVALVVNQFPKKTDYFAVYEGSANRLVGCLVMIHSNNLNVKYSHEAIATILTRTFVPQPATISGLDLTFYF